MSISGNGASGKVGRLAATAEELESLVRDVAARGGTLRDVEQGTFDLVLKMGHRAVELFLSLQGNGDLGETAADADGRTLHRSDEPVVRPLRTIFGQHEFSAYVYRESVDTHAPIVFRPIDLRMGLAPGRCSLLLEEFTQLFCIEQAHAPAAKAFERIFRQRLSVDTLERSNLRMGGEAAEFLADLVAPPDREEGELLVVTADGKGVPMVKGDAAKLLCFEDSPLRPGNRRMATLAGVYSVDRYVRTPDEIVAALFRDVRDLCDEAAAARPEPCHKRIIARFPQVLEETGETAPIGGSILALSWAAREVEQRRRKNQPLVLLVDGQPSLWSDADACLGGLSDPDRVEVLDVVHVAGYVWKAAKVFHAHREHQEAFVRDRLLRILQGDVAGVITGLRRMATTRGLTGSARREITTVCGYFTTHAHRMRYDEYLKQGFPIATGVIEGACRHLVKDRMERSGMRWTLPQAQAMLDVRAMHQSSHWNEFHKHRATQHATPPRRYAKLLANLTPLAA